MAVPSKYQAKEVLNKVLNSGEDALNVDLADSVSVTVDSEFPAASAISDNFANPTTTSAMSMLMGYDGSTWDRVTIGGGTEAAALRVTIANDSTGVVSVDDGGGALTVDGTVTANLGTTDNAVLDAIDAVLDTIKIDTEAIETAVEAVNQAAEGTITSTTQRVTIATDDDGVAHLATIAGAVSTQMQVDVVAALPAGSNTIGVVDLGSTDNAVLDAMVVDLAAMETLLTAANVDHAANEALLTTIDSDTNDTKNALNNMLYGTALAVTAVHGGSDHSLGATYEAFHIGVGGDISLDCVTSGTNIVFKNVASGQMLPVRATVVNATNTTATNIVALKA
jgi:hypothetical protein